jgi:N-ethylmaleimide reductase
VSNVRTDKYGGSIDNRLRFMREVIEAILAKGVPRERVWIRFAPNGAYGGMGSADNVETFNEAIRQAASYKLGCIEVLDGLAFGFHEKCAPYTLPMARAATLLGNPDGTTAVMANCGYTKETAEKAVAEGHADLVSFGRPYISNPDLPERFFEDLPLAEPAAYPDWWTKTDADGYTTFPPAQRATA